MKDRTIEEFIKRPFNKDLTTSERDILDQWIVASQENKEKFEGYKDEYLSRQSRRAISSGAIDVEGALIKTKKRINEFRYKRAKRFFIPAAAIVVVLMAVTFLVNEHIGNGYLTNHSKEIVYQEVTAAYGTKTKLLLADGTSVWLNSGSTLKFPLSFTDLDERRVYLNGEGYFDVVKNTDKPFIVNTEKVNVKVYGTSFNVSAYKDHNSMLVALVEGKVSLVEDFNGTQKELNVLKPRDVVECDFETNKIKKSSNVEMEKYTAWKDGYMMFYGDPIDTIIRKVEKWYNVDIVIEDIAIETYRFTATFHDESLEQMLDLLILSSPMDYKIIPSQKLSNNTFSVRKVILTKTKNL